MYPQGVMLQSKLCVRWLSSIQNLRPFQCWTWCFCQFYAVLNWYFFFPFSSQLLAPRLVNQTPWRCETCLSSFGVLSMCLWFRGKEPLKDSVVSTYEEHEDSVYAAEWSSADPWLFASLSYDGRLVINRVPRALKYRILLWDQKSDQRLCVCAVNIHQFICSTDH